MGEDGVRGESAVEYFKALVEGALTHQKLVVNELTAFYVVRLLAGFVDQPVDESAAMALRLADAFERGGLHQRQALKQIGDTSLFVSGFFPDSFNNGLVDAEYYVQVGEVAYAALSRHERGQLSSVFAELAKKFNDVVEIVSEVSERSTGTSNRDVLRLYERWLKTGSRHCAQILMERGVVPLRAPSTRVQ
jgi:hypothetical protein